MTGPMTATRSEQAAAWAARLAEGRLNARDEAELEAWLDADPSNGEEMEAIAAAWAAVDHYAAAPELVALRESCFTSADFLEGITAFGEKRKPHWTGH